MNLDLTLHALDIDPDSFRREFEKGVRAEDGLVAALHFGAAGYHMFPATIKKTPLCDWDAEATCDPRGIIRLYRRVKNFYGVPECWCIRTGREFGLWVFDVDGRKGRKHRAALESQHGTLPADTPTVTTGRKDGGEHLWIMPTPDGPDLKSVGGAFIDGIKRKGIDQKGRGGYAVAPGSRHADGPIYRFTEGHALGEIAMAEFSPEWLEIVDWADEIHESSATRSGSGGTKRKPSVPHDPSSYVIGDDGGGFNSPIRKRCCQFFALFGVDADAAEFKDALRFAILNANAADHTSEQVARYASDGYLDAEIASARKFISNAA